MGIVRAAQRLVEISLVEELLDLPVDQIIILEPRRGQRPVAQAVRRTVGGAALSVGEQRGARPVGRSGRLNTVRRSEEGRVGKEWLRTCRNSGCPSHNTKK